MESSALVCLLACSAEKGRSSQSRRSASQSSANPSTYAAHWAPRPSPRPSTAAICAARLPPGRSSWVSSAKHVPGHRFDGDQLDLLLERAAGLAEEVAQHRRQQRLAWARRPSGSRPAPRSRSPHRARRGPRPGSPRGRSWPGERRWRARRTRRRSPPRAPWRSPYGGASVSPAGRGNRRLCTEATPHNDRNGRRPRPFCPPVPTPYAAPGDPPPTPATPDPAHQPEQQGQPEHEQDRGDRERDPRVMDHQQRDHDDHAVLGEARRDVGERLRGGVDRQPRPGLDQWLASAVPPPRPRSRPARPTWPHRTRAARWRCRPSGG